jgi:uncharacterized membrane protein YfcA
MLTGNELALAGEAAVVAGIISAVAGDGTLISFPALIGLGIPPVTANITNTVALCPRYLGRALAQRKDLAGQRNRLIHLLPAGAIGGLIGGILLLFVSSQLFRGFIPFLTFFAVVLLALQDRSRDWILRHAPRTSTVRGEGSSAILPVGLAAVYRGILVRD